MSTLSHTTSPTSTSTSLDTVCAGGSSRADEEYDVFTNSNSSHNSEKQDKFCDYQPSSAVDFEVVQRDMVTSSGTGYDHREFSRREILKAKLKYHYMNPWQKYKARKRKPWKLVIQIFKILIVTVQVTFSVYQIVSVSIVINRKYS